jgi:hypothetical protein
MSYPPPPRQFPPGEPGYPPPPGDAPATGYLPSGFAPPGPLPPGGAPPGALAGPGAIAPQRGRKKYNSFTALFVFFLPDLWRDVGQRWWGIGLTYLLLLMALTWLPPFFKWHAGLAGFVAVEAPKMTTQVPTVTLNNGDISIDRPEPYTITDTETGKPLVVFDTTGGTTEPPLSVPSVLVTKHGFSMRKSASEIQVQDLSQVKGVHQLNGNDVQGWLNTGVGAWWPVGYPAMTILSLLWRIFLTLIFATIGLAFASGMRAPLTYAALLRLSAVAMTPVVLLDTLFLMVPSLDVGCFWTIAGAVIDLLMLFLAVRANAPKTPTSFSGQQGFPLSPLGWAPPGVNPNPYSPGPLIPPPPQ